MQTTVVGSGDSFGSGGRFPTCIALSTHASRVAPHSLIDCGVTSLVALRQQGFTLNEIETIFVTHLHGDHFGGLPFLILDGQFRRRTDDHTTPTSAVIEHAAEVDMGQRVMARSPRPPGAGVPAAATHTAAPAQ